VLHPSEPTRRRRNCAFSMTISPGKEINKVWIQGRRKGRGGRARGPPRPGERRREGSADKGRTAP
jgi:hypothetical protein